MRWCLIKDVIQDHNVLFVLCFLHRKNIWVTMSELKENQYYKHICYVLYEFSYGLWS